VVFSSDHVCNSDYENALEFSEDKEDDWYSILRTLGVWSEDYSVYDRALKIFGIRSVDQVLDQHLTRPEEEPKEDKKTAEHKATGSSHRVLISVSYQERCYCNVQRS
jgi:ADP-glucose pyrophosphorylase